MIKTKHSAFGNFHLHAMCKEEKGVHILVCMLMIWGGGLTFLYTEQVVS